jgi:chemotaxis protein methyltransferase CheR
MALKGQTRQQEAPDDPHVARLMEDLRAKSGLKRDDLLARKIAGVLRQRAPGERAAWVDDLIARPSSDPAWLAFVEAVTVHETYFFRDPGQLAALAERYLPDMLAAKAAAGDRSLRVWSAGCASGEEAYTAAILLREAIAARGEAPEDWSIAVTGGDISRAILAQAAEGVYGGPGLNAFRRMPARHAVHFVDCGADQPGRRQVVPRLAALVRFRQHNLMDPEPPETGFDIVMCRNVFIYFDEAAQQRAVATLRKGLAEGGYLLLGVTDRLPPGSGFVREASGTAVIYRRAEGA